MPRVAPMVTRCVVSDLLNQPAFLESQLPIMEGSPLLTRFRLVLTDCIGSTAALLVRIMLSRHQRR